MSDQEVDRAALPEVVSKGNTRESLIALRDYVAHELESNRCDRCRMSQLKTGDTAALVLRLQKIIEDIEKLPAERDTQAEQDAGVTSLATIRARRGDRPADAPDSSYSNLGTRSGPRRQGGRKSSG